METTKVMAMESSGKNVCDYSHNLTFFYKLVDKKIPEGWTTREVAVLAVGLTLCLIVVLANLMVMVAIFKNRRFHYPIYYLLGNMAAADLFAGIAYTNLILNTGPWTRNLTKQQWFVRGALIDISLTSSVANLLAVAVERHQTIITMQLHSRMTKRRVLVLIMCIWAIGIVMGLVPSVFWNCECDHTDCSTIAPLYSRKFLIFWAVLNLLTFFIMVAMYTRIFIYVRRKSQQGSRHATEIWRGQAVVNLMKTISMVLGAFIICWTPGLIVLLLDGVLGKVSNAVKYEKYCLVIAECNSLVNPIIYSLRDDEMRRTFKSILCWLCGRGSEDNRRGPSAVPFDAPQLEEGIVCVQKSEENGIYVSQAQHMNDRQKLDYAMMTSRFLQPEKDITCSAVLKDIHSGD